MTCRERLKLDAPTNIGPQWFGSCMGCPHHYGYLEKPDYCNNDRETCQRCWDREIPEDDEEASGKINHIPYENMISSTEAADILNKILQPDTTDSPRILDSGNRRQFASGAVRDIQEGKGDMVSLPNAAILRLSKHYENGALKYGRWNYTKGIPVSSFMDSALRHLFKYLDGWDDEDHLSAAAFNVLGAMEMEAKHKELLDIPSREGKNCFDY